MVNSAAVSNWLFGMPMLLLPLLLLLLWAGV